MLHAGRVREAKRSSYAVSTPAPLTDAPAVNDFANLIKLAPAKYHPTDALQAQLLLGALPRTWPQAVIDDAWLVRPATIPVSVPIEETISSAALRPSNRASTPENVCAKRGLLAPPLPPPPLLSPPHRWQPRPPPPRGTKKTRRSRTPLDPGAAAPEPVVRPAYEPARVAVAAGKKQRRPRNTHGRG